MSTTAKLSRDVGMGIDGNEGKGQREVVVWIVDWDGGRGEGGNEWEQEQVFWM